MRKTLEVYKASTYVRLTGYKPELIKQILMPFCKRNFARVQKVPGELYGTHKWEVTHVFARFNNDKTELRFCASMLPELLKLMTGSGYKESRISIQDEKVIKPKKIKIDLLNPDKFAPRDEEQEEFCEFMMDPSPLSINNLPPGRGKTFTALYSAYHIGERVLITVLPRFVDIWVKAFGEFYNIKPEDVVVADIIGVTELHQAIVNNVIDPKIIILPLTKIDIYLKKLREDESLPSLDQVFDDLGCGIRVIDEAHESIYSVYNSLMFGNHKRTFVLSGTLKGDDEFVNKIYNAIFPFSCYLRSPEHTPYMHVVAYFHRMDMFKHRINVKGFGGFSHNLLEAGILKRPHLFESYYQMLLGAFKQFYLDEYREGQKCLWFFATIDFCEKFNERLLQDYPELDSIVFNSKTNKKDPNGYREHRNVVTTPGSCGTGKDIPKLFTVFSPIAVSSSQRNNQMVCRTRPVDKWWPDLMPNFVYFVCSDIPKTVEYGRKRRELFQGVCKKFSIIDSGVRL